MKEKRPSGLFGCPLLTSTYPDGKCPFAKAKITDVSYETLRLRDLRNKKAELEAAGL